MENKDILLYILIALVLLCLLNTYVLQKKISKIMSKSNISSNSTPTPTPKTAEKFTSEGVLENYSSGSFPNSGNKKVVTIDSNGNMDMFEFPKGVIVAWAGASNQIPVGWSLCDGSGETPDLRGRFILGTDNNKYQVGALGGSEKLAPHTHRYFDGHFAEAGNNNPDFRQKKSLATRDTDLVSDNDQGFANRSFGSAASDNDNTVRGFMRNTFEQPEYVDGTLSKDNNSTASAMPPYFALCYIMKNN